MSDTEDRLRPHPSERFAGARHYFDLRAAVAELRAEPHPSQKRHRQKTLFQRLPVTQVLFTFEEGGVLEDHAARGLVTIQALEGHLQVQADGETYDLPAGSQVVLNPLVRHSVHATVDSAMLLTVCLEKDR